MVDDFLPPVILGADTIEASSGTLTRLADAAPKFIGTAAISGGLSIYNTFLDYNGQEAVDTSRYIQEYDQSWGDFYEQNKQAVDLAGFVGTSLVPGGLGIKALKLARSGQAEGAIARALGFASSRRDAALSTAMQELARSGGTITGSVTAAKRAQLAWGIADDVLLSAAAETAVVATMNDSPIFEGDDFGDFAKNIAFGALFGGVVGGALGHWGTRGILKRAQDKIQTNRREFDTVVDTAKFGLTKSDEVLTYAENILRLPDDFYNTNFTYQVGGKSKTLVLDTSEAFRSLKDQAERTAFKNLELKFHELAGGAVETGNAFSRMILKRVADGKAAGKNADGIIDDISGYLQNLRSVRNLDETSGAVSAPDQFFVNLKPTGFGDLFTPVRGKGTGKQAYYLVTDDPTKIRFGSQAQSGFKSVDEAFEMGFDAVFTKDGHVAINPKSQVILRTPDKALNNKFYLDLETGSLTPEVKPVVGDLVRNVSDVSFRAEGLYVGKKFFQQVASKAADLADSPLNASARFAWASKLDAAALNDRTIAWNDFPLLDRMVELGEVKQLPKIKLADDTIVKWEDVARPQEYINQLKLDFLTQSLNKEIKGYDVRELAAHLNVDRQWVETAIANNFAPTKELVEFVQPLNRTLRPTTVELEWGKNLQQVVTESGGFVGPNYAGTRLLAHHYALEVQKRTWDNAVRSVLGEDADLFPDAIPDLARQTSERGAGATTFGASNADYGKIAEHHVQATGKATNLVRTKLRDQAINSIASEINGIRQSPEAAAELGVLTTALRRDPQKYYLDTEGGRLVDREAYKRFDAGEFSTLDDAISFLKKQDGRRGQYKIEQEETLKFFETYRNLNMQAGQKQTTLLNASGIARERDGAVIHAPSVDTRRYPYFAFVRAKERIGSNTDVSMITAKSADQLRELASRVGDEYEVIYKADTEQFYKVKGQYDYNSAINESKINSDLQRRGVLGDFFPETRAENVLTDYVTAIGNQQDLLVRTAVQVKNREFLGGLDFLAENWEKTNTSAFQYVQALRRDVANPFRDYAKTMLDLSKQSEFPLLDSLNEMVDRVSTKLYSSLDSLWTTARNNPAEGMVSYRRANELMEEAGLSGPYKGMEEYLVANEKMPRNIIRDTFRKANHWLATIGLRFDFANSIINVVSTPIMLGTEFSSIKQLASKDPELIGKLQELYHVKVPGQQVSVPSFSKLLFNSVGNFFGADKKALIERYKANGDIRNVAQLYHEVLDDLAYVPNQKADAWKTRVDAAIEKGAKITGNTFSEEFTRFISADVMRQMTEPLVQAGRMTVKEQNAYMSSFVNRVQGNYVYSQRPVVFQGTTGAAVSLFQTYAFNLLQQLFRHVENRDARTLAVFGGLQSSLYGFNGLPFFDAINTHLIGQAAGNPQHHDAYSVLPAAQKELGNWLLYGTASAFPLFGDKVPALYSRGDINPRHITILPVNPLDVPAVSASIKLVDSLIGFGKNVSKGADISTAMLQAVEHHGWSRPLAGFAQVLAGQSTTGKGSLISAASDMESTAFLARVQDRMVEFGGAARILGARPMDEAVALNQLYRIKNYEAIDRLKLEALGKAVKTKLSNNQMPTDEEMESFMQSYVNSGGRIETFSSSMQRWMRDSNTSIVNQMATKLTSPYSKKLQEIMGGDMLSDYTTLANQE